ncbi:FGGY-family carbohydrate kinase [Paracoccus tegillarcae]|uniref:Ribulokinase n=1 Tax=Paracoccus tegillarcae TaxID=1529068 RepID=A0A2K9F5B3_9RHOB|nr:FGGY-family carbohydrate kinase [Paracoccus tegillarcae]AUH34361.1 ribulokinase [Paracoccus tegillarcae]
MTCFMGIDVGTGSARAGIFDAVGRLLGKAASEIETFREGADIVEQSSAQIWSAVCGASRAAIAQAGVDPSDVVGLGFDATCSLVVLDETGNGLPVGASEDPARDIIVWMDHRATAEARDINATKHPVLAYVGGVISPEMQTPKLLWLRRHRPQIYVNAAHFFDLTDFLTWKATGSLARSDCTVTCKWTYVAGEGGWNADYFDQIGLEDLAREGFRRIGAQIVPPGTPLAQGLTDEAARALGLARGTAVAAGLIDAHAGGLGTVGASGLGPATQNMGYVFGTSSCTMTTTTDPVFVPGVWGPYFSAMLPGMWLNEGGQSAAGAAIDRLIRLHPAFDQVSALAGRTGQSTPDWLMQTALAGAGSASDAARLADGLIVVPEFLGNRAPHADPDTRAVIAGLGMGDTPDSLVALYIAGICGLGYGLRQILHAQAARGAAVERIVISGGAGRNPALRQLLADATGTPVVAPESDEPVLLGAAMLGACASDSYDSLAKCMPAMSRVSQTHEPAQGETARLHARRFDLYERLHDVARQVAVQAR